MKKKDTSTMVWIASSSYDPYFLRLEDNSRVCEDTKANGEWTD